MKIITIVILIVFIITLYLKLYKPNITEYFTFTISKEVLSSIYDKTGFFSQEKGIPLVETLVEEAVESVESAEEEAVESTEEAVEESAEEAVEESAEEEAVEAPIDDTTSINSAYENSNILDQSTIYYKPEFEPNVRLEKTKRPNGYDFVNKDNIEPNVRNKSENNIGFKHIKPGKNLYNSYGYSYMPPESWSVPQDRPPVCIPQKGFKAEAVPLYTIGTPLNALEIQQTLMPKFKYDEVYDPKYYYPGWKSK
jgi:hypothetical protein